MKLLFDHNLSPRLVNRLADIFPNSSHLFLLGLEQVPDQEVWHYARDRDYIIVTKDSDFNEIVILLSFPPKVIWIRRGNCSTREIETILRTHFIDIENFNQDQKLGIFTLY
jgi:predicted nuclease of predicted toxin-antitoxin system